jgi:DNA-binding GntR family transcriptional regulator
MEETYQLRLLLDPFATKAAVPRMGAAELERMDAALASLTRSIMEHDLTTYDADHRAFHFSIYEFCGSKWLLDIQSVLWENSMRYQRLSAGLRGTPEQRVMEHSVIADACRLGEAAQTADLVFQHLDRTRTVLGKVLSAPEECSTQPNPYPEHRKE